MPLWISAAVLLPVCITSLEAVLQDASASTTALPEHNALLLKLGKTRFEGRLSARRPFYILSFKIFLYFVFLS